MNIIQLIATGFLTVYIIGALYFLIAITSYMIRRERNREVSLFVDVLARLLTVLNVTLFWPINLFTN